MKKEKMNEMLKKIKGIIEQEKKEEGEVRIGNIFHKLVDIFEKNDIDLYDNPEGYCGIIAEKFEDGKILWAGIITNSALLYNGNCFIGFWINDNEEDCGEAWDWWYGVVIDEETNRVFIDEDWWYNVVIDEKNK